MALTPLASPLTSTGVVLEIVEPLPSWPYSLSPQHLTPPPVVSAQVCKVPPAEMALIPFASPLTSTGVVRWSTVVPSPNCPSHPAPST